MHHQRCEIDRRSVRVKLTTKGREVQAIMKILFRQNGEKMQSVQGLDAATVMETTKTLARLERFWTEQIRYIY